MDLDLYAMAYPDTFISAQVGSKIAHSPPQALAQERT
jgi:hypothetical protein